MAMTLNSHNYEEEHIALGRDIIDSHAPVSLRDRVLTSVFTLFLSLITDAQTQSSNLTSIPIGDDRIVGGAAIKVINRNFQVAVLLGPYLCGGSLLTMEWVLSAGHCVNGQTAAKTYVRAGSNNYNYGGVVRYAKQLFLHPNFDINTLNNDISMILLQSPFVESPYIGTVSIASALPPVGAQLQVSGFGTTSSGGNLAPYLETVYVNMIALSQCQSDYNNELTSTMFCAGVPNGGKDSCQGDSGGPLTYNGKLVGVVSWGDGCATAAHPGIYTNAPLFISWINSTMSSN
ncbi:trypsin alpha-3-like [Condylostylus longicornis]|uniref:trypsin alpha-3-like n=1 Tax=Condylostylus longicornis TaxID=2530218 RepID=UPI00244E30F2|nr:trypsin alpha-3-like [Condylostylus longicornis]